MLCCYIFQNLCIWVEGLMLIWCESGFIISLQNIWDAIAYHYLSREMNTLAIQWVVGVMSFIHFPFHDNKITRTSIFIKRARCSYRWEKYCLPVMCLSSQTFNGFCMFIIIIFILKWPSSAGLAEAIQPCIWHIHLLGNWIFQKPISLFWFTSQGFFFLFFF